MKKQLLVVLLTIATLVGCKKGDDTDGSKSFSKDLPGKTFTKYHSTLYDKYMEFSYENTITVSVKDHSGKIFEQIDIETYKYEIDGVTGTSISVTIPKEGNSPEKKIKGSVLEESVTFSEYPLRGSYSLLK